MMSIAITSRASIAIFSPMCCILVGRKMTAVINIDCRKVGVKL